MGLIGTEELPQLRLGEVVVTRKGGEQVIELFAVEEPSRIVPLKRSTNAFCCGLPFSMKAVFTPCSASQPVSVSATLRELD